MADQDQQDQYEDDFDSNESEYFEEFDDAESSLDDGEWDEMDEDAAGDYQQQPAPQKKKSSFLTYLLIGVVVLGGGAFAVSQMGGGGEEVTGIDVAETGMPEMPVDASADVPQIVSDTPSEVVMPESADSQMPVPVSSGDGNDAAAIPSEGDLVSLTPDDNVPVPESASTPASVSESQGQTAAVFPSSLPELGGGLMTVPDMAASDVSAPAPIVAEVSQEPRTNDFPSVDMIKRTDKQPSEDVSQNQVGDVAPVAVQAESDISVTQPPIEAQTLASGAVNTQETSVSVSSQGLSDAAPADDLMKSEMRKAVDQIAELQATVEKQEEQRSDYMSQISALKQQVSDLESKLARSSERASERESSVSVATPVKASSRENIAVRSSVKAEKSPVWVLKSAQKTRALLSRDGQSDIRTVSVGDKVPGLGTILSIDQSREGWVVVGTTGRVTE